MRLDVSLPDDIACCSSSTVISSSSNGPGECGADVAGVQVLGRGAGATERDEDNKNRKEPTPGRMTGDLVYGSRFMVLPVPEQVLP